MSMIQTTSALSANATRIETSLDAALDAKRPQADPTNWPTGEQTPAQSAERGPGCSPVELTLVKKTDGPCTKRISLEGGKVVSDGSACAIWDGTAKRLPIKPFQGQSATKIFASILTRVGEDKAICLGRLISEVADKVPLVTEKRRRQSAKKDAISRTQEYLRFVEGEPAFMLIDFDRKGMPQDIAARVDAAGGAWNALVGAVPELAHAARVSRASTSAGIYNSQTGQTYPGSGGEHHYILVADGSDIPRALQDLHDRAWLAGLGWYMVGAAGQLLERSIVDKTVGSPERLVFEGNPITVPPLLQDMSKRVPLVSDGIAIDTDTVIPLLTEAERSTVNALKAAAKDHLRPEATRVRDNADRALANEMSARDGIHFDTALRRIRARHKGVLLPPIVLEFDDSSIGQVTVGQLLADPDRFLGETLADPLEGVSYGRCKAKVMQGDDGQLIIHSFAHGGAVYRLLLDAPSLEELINSSPEQSAVDVLTANLHRAELAPDEVDRLRQHVAHRANVGLRAVNSRIKSEDQERTQANAERAAAAMPIDPRITFPAPAEDAELTPVVSKIDEILSQVNDPEPPMRTASGTLCEVRERPALGLHLLMPEGDQPIPPDQLLPAPAEPLISELDLDQTTMTIEKFIRYTREKPHPRAVRLPTPFVHAFHSYAGSALPRVAGVVTSPLVNEHGLLATNGLDRKLEMVFRIPQEIRELVPNVTEVSDIQAQYAYRFLADEWLCDVQTSEEGKAIIIVSALTLIERVLLPERPAFFVTAGQRGGGKTTSINMISTAVFGRRASAASWSDNVEERRKSILSYLRDGPAMIAWDNLTRGANISCPVLERALTSPTITDRLLGVSEQITASSTTVHFLTGNNILPSGDMSSRSFVIRIEVDRPDPENRVFKHSNPIEWTQEHRAEILRALYTILVWNPMLHMAPDVRPIRTRFRRWWTLCAYPVVCLSAVKLDEILSARESEDAEVTGMAALLSGLLGTFGTGDFTAAQLLHLAHNLPSSEHASEWILPVQAALEEATGKPFAGSFEARTVGKKLQIVVGRPVQIGADIIVLHRVSDSKAGNRYRVAKTSQ